MHQVGRVTPFLEMGLSIEKPVCKSWRPCYLAKPAWSVMGPLKRIGVNPNLTAILGARTKRLGCPPMLINKYIYCSC
jgi:hypothetical protein